MIFLIRADHSVQHDGNNSANISLRNKFSIFLKEKAKEYKVALIAEEFNEDALKLSQGKKSTADNVVEQLKYEGFNIDHMFCEMSLSERKSRGILSPNEIYSKVLNIHFFKGESPDLSESQQKIFDKEMEKSFLARETFWFERISDYSGKNIIFVCGLKHIISFEKLLVNKGLKPIILDSPK